jgi:hypothetical protein
MQINTIIDRTDLLSLCEAARRLPGRPHRSTLWRWARKGIETSRGRVRLKVLRLGRRVLIDPVNVAEFAQALAEADIIRNDVRPLAMPASTRRSSRAEVAEREADALGI